MPGEERSNNNGNNSDVIEFLKLITITTYTQRVDILRNITKKQFRYIRQVAFNILFNSSIPLSVKEKQYLQRHSASIKKLASKRTCLDEKRIVLSGKQLLIKKLCEIALKYLE